MSVTICFYMFFFATHGVLLFRAVVICEIMTVLSGLYRYCWEVLDNQRMKAMRNAVWENNCLVRAKIILLLNGNQRKILLIFFSVIFLSSIKMSNKNNCAICNIRTSHGECVPQLQIWASKKWQDVYYMDFRQSPFGLRENELDLFFFFFI